MLEIGQWVILAAAVIVCFLLIISVTRLFLRALLAIICIVFIAWALYYFQLLPEPVQKYMDEMLCEENIEKVKSVLPEYRSQGNKAPSETNMTE